MELFSNQFFGMGLTLIVYALAQKLRKSYKNPFLNPVLTSTVIIIIVLLIIKVPYEAYFNGGSIISFFVGPSTVALAMPLYKNRNLLIENFASIITGTIFGVIGTLGSTLILVKIFELGEEISFSIMPHSVTTAIATELAGSYNGIESLTVASVIITGITGAIIGPIIFKRFNLKNPIAQGISMGTASHAVGTARALEMGEKQGSMSSLAIVLAGIITTIVFPLFMRFF
ncbi:MAG: LrgB family protein [Filifactoraceae bacterium]